MKTIAFFNGRSGVGKTTLAYHLGWMMAEQGARVLLADLDPKAQLSSWALGEAEFTNLWNGGPASTIGCSIHHFKNGYLDIDAFPLHKPHELRSGLNLMYGDPCLSGLEENFADEWSQNAGDDKNFRLTISIHNLLLRASQQVAADIVLLDLGSNYGAINRAALLSADHVILPTTVDPLSTQNILDSGLKLASWRRGWKTRLDRTSASSHFSFPSGKMEPIGYVVSPSPTHKYAVRDVGEWRSLLPSTYSHAVFGKSSLIELLGEDPNCLLNLPNYPSVVEMSKSAARPIFDLKPADGAMGGHLSAARACHFQYKTLSERVLKKIDFVLDDMDENPSQTVRP